MKFQSPIMKTLILSSMILLLLGWTRDKTIQITPVQPAVPERSLSTMSGVKIKVYKFLDATHYLTIFLSDFFHWLQC